MMCSAKVSSGASGSPLGVEAKQIMARGDLVPDQVMIPIVEERLDRGDCGPGFVLDGFPRTEAQAQALDRLLTDLGTPLDCCLVIRVDGEAVVERLTTRAEIEGRSDDNEQTIGNRLKVYREQTEPLIEYYRSAGLLQVVDGEGGVDAIYQRLLDCLGLNPA